MLIIKKLLLHAHFLVISCYALRDITSDNLVTELIDNAKMQVILSAKMHKK